MSAGKAVKSETVASIGEFGLIRGITNHLMGSAVKSAGVILPPGDDAAIWQPRPGRQVVISTDMLIEGSHFRHDWSSAESTGHRAIAVNVSDIAAMGARPRVAVVSLGLRSATRDRWVYDFYKGAMDFGKKYHLRIVGGDIVRSHSKTIISVTVVGELPKRAAGLRRNKARPGDIVAVTGPLGLAAAGVRILTENQIKVDGAPQMLDAHRRPSPRVLEGILLRRAGVEAAMDISDGLFGDLPKICEASNVSATLRHDRIPVPSAVRWNFPDDWFDLGTRGGEDFELLFTCSEETFERVRALFRRFKLAEPIVIGELVAASERHAPVRLKGLDLRTTDVIAGAFDHFQPALV